MTGDENDSEKQPPKDLTGLNELSLTGESAPESAFVETPQVPADSDAGQLEEFSSLPQFHDPLIEKTLPGPGTRSFPTGISGTESETGEAGDTFATEPTFGAHTSSGSQTELENEPEALGASAAMSPPAGSTMDTLRDYSERMAVGAPQVEASFPFNLRITGLLKTEEKERLVEILMRENMGIREMDLETQFSENRVLIPRISEYAGVMLVQALRGSHAEIRLEPASREADDMLSSELRPDVMDIQFTSAHPAELMPLTTDSQLPDGARFTVVDAVTASTSLRANAIEAESSAEYQEALEQLQKELKYKAHGKGANAILNFNVTLTPLSAPFRYRVTAIGSAVKLRPDAP